MHIFIGSGASANHWFSLLLLFLIFQVYEETGLRGYQVRLISQKDVCFDTSEMENIRVLVAKKCDVRSEFQRFQFDYQIVKV